MGDNFPNMGVHIGYTSRRPLHKLRKRSTHARTHALTYTGGEELGCSRWSFTRTTHTSSSWGCARARDGRGKRSVIHTGQRTGHDMLGSPPPRPPLQRYRSQECPRNRGPATQTPHEHEPRLRREDHEDPRRGGWRSTPRSRGR